MLGGMDNIIADASGKEKFYLLCIYINSFYMEKNHVTFCCGLQHFMLMTVAGCLAFGRSIRCYDDPISLILIPDKLEI